MALFKNGLEKASAELARLREARVQLDERAEKARAELLQLRSQLPTVELAVMLEPSSKSLATNGRARLRELEDELETCKSIQPALIDKLRDAMRAVNVAKAEDVRKRAVALEKQLSAHKAKSDELRLALEAHEGCAFSPEVKQVANDSGERGWQYAVSTSMRLANQIAALHSEAVAIENKKLAGGGAGVETLDELLQAVATDPDTIPPLPSAIRVWFAGAFAEAEADFRRGDYGSDFPSLASFPVEQSISLSWDENGVILPGSAVRLRLAPINRQVAEERFGAQYQRGLAAD